MKSTIWVVLGLVLALALGPAYPALASDPGTNPQNETTSNQLGMGLASFFGTLIYSPIKIGYAVLGGVTGGMGWALTGGDTEVATRVFRPSMRGTYVLTPDHLTGAEPIHFVGASTYSSRSSGSASDGPASRTASRTGKVEDEQF